MIAPRRVGGAFPNDELSRPDKADRMWPTVSFDPPSAGDSRGKRRNHIFNGEPLPGLVRPRAHDPMARAMGHIRVPSMFDSLGVKVPFTT